MENFCCFVWYIGKLFLSLRFKLIIMEIQKAYKLVVDNLLLDDPYHYEAPIVYAKTAGEAKSKGIKYFYDYRVEDMYDYGRYNEREITFTDIKAKRDKNSDKFLYKDQWEIRERISQLEWEDKRDEEAKQIWLDNPDGIAVVWAGCYNSYWGANHAGYYSNIINAGKYSTKEAYDIVRGSDYSRQEKVVLLNKEEYNNKIMEKAHQLLNSMV